MKRFILIFFISVVLPALTINHINNIVYAQDVSFKDITTKSNNNQIESKTTDLSYKYEPFISLNGKDFEDISQNNTISIENFAIAAWINTNQSTLLEPAHIVNKGGFNTDEKGENMNYGIWFSTNGTISGGFEIESGENFEVNSTEKI